MSPVVITRPYNVSIPFIKTLSLADATPNDQGFDVAVAPSGNFYVQTKLWTSGASEQSLITAYDSNFNLRWEKMAGLGTDLATEVVIDSSENVYALCYAAPQNWIVKYDTNGNVLWKIDFNNEDYFQPFGGAIDSGNNLCMAGRGGPIFGNDGMMCKIDGTGTLVWDQLFRNAATTDWITGAATFGTDIFVSGGGNSGYFVVGKFNSAGTLQWQRQLNDTGTEVGNYCHVDSSGNLYATGSSNSASAGGTVGVNSLILAKWNNTGTLQWQRSLTSGVGGSESGRKVTTDASGNVYVIGTTDKGGSGRSDLLVSKWDSSGNLLFQRTFNSATTGNVYGYGIGISGSLMILTGTTEVNPFGGSGDSLVMRVPTDGSKTGTYGAYSYEVSTLTANVSTIPESAGPNAVTTPPSGAYLGVVLDPGTAVVAVSGVTETIIA